MTVPGEAYIIYVRGTQSPVNLDPGARPRTFRMRQFNPRTGEFTHLGEREIASRYEYRAPDNQDWVVLLEAR
jgi:hypothetical protein